MAVAILATLKNSDWLIDWLKTTLVSRVKRSCSAEVWSMIVSFFFHFRLFPVLSRPLHFHLSPSGPHPSYSSRNLARGSKEAL